MAQVKRTTSRLGIGGGKLALFEVLQASQASGEGIAGDPSVPLVQSTAQAAGAVTAAPVTPPARPAAAARGGQVPEHLLEPGTAAVRPMPSRGGSGRSGRSRSGGGGLGLLVAAATLAGIVGGALYLGHRLSTSAASQLGSAGQPNPEVLDVGEGSKPGAITKTPSGTALGAPAPQVQSRAQSGSQMVVVPEGFRRTSGLNYVLVQSYAPSEEDRAIATRDALLAAGVGATIEPNIAGWPKKLCVVGTVGFERIRSNPEYDAYVKQLRQVSDRERGNRKIKSFDPTPFQWSRD